MAVAMADFLSTVAYVLTVWLFALHLVFDRRFRRRLRILAKQQRQLERRLAAMERQDTWVVGNSQFSHAPWVLVCLSGSRYRVAGRYFDKSRLLESREWLSETSAVLYEPELQSRRVYRGCFDLYGVFADVGSFGSLKDLPEDASRLLKGGFTVASPVDSVDPLVVATELVSVVAQPTVVPVKRVLPPLFSARFN